MKIGYFRTETDLAYQDGIEGNLFAQVDRTVDLLRTKYSKAEISYDGIYRRETPPAPGEALRGAVLNAVAHRDYGDPAPIQIQVYDDRIALWNPGALPPDWTLDRLMGTHASAPHNPGIANAFFHAGMVEARGHGVGDIVRACKAAGTTQPRWEVEPGGLRLEFAFTRAGDDPRSRNAAHEPARGERRRPESLAARVLRQLADGPMSKANLSGSLGAEANIGSAQQGDPAACCRWKRRIHDTRKASQPTPEVPPDGQGTGCPRRVIGRERWDKSVGRAGRP